MLRKLYQGIASSSRKLSEGNSADPDSGGSSKAQVHAEQQDEAAKYAADAHQEVDGSRPTSLDAFRKSLKTGIKVGSRAPLNASRLLDADGALSVQVVHAFTPKLRLALCRRLAMTVLTTIRDLMARGTRVGASIQSILPVCNLQHSRCHCHLSAVLIIEAVSQPQWVP